MWTSFHGAWTCVLGRVSQNSVRYVGCPGSSRVSCWCLCFGARFHVSVRRNFYLPVDNYSSLTSSACLLLPDRLLLPEQNSSMVDVVTARESVREIRERLARAAEARRGAATFTACVEDAECPICMEPVPEAASEREACSNEHIFCLKCIRQTACSRPGLSLRCPVCRTSMEAAAERIIMSAPEYSAMTPASGDTGEGRPF